MIRRKEREREKRREKREREERERKREGVRGRETLDGEKLFLIAFFYFYFFLKFLPPCKLQVTMSVPQLVHHVSHGGRNLRSNLKQRPLR